MTKYDTDKPIYLQIIDRITKQVIRGEIKPGDKLPSVREMAIQSEVNPNTVQRTYQEMERMGMVETRRGQGTFVTENNTVLIQLKVEMEKQVIERFINGMRELGIEDQNIVHSVQMFLKGGEDRD
ncbi:MULTISPECIES: GntR family transcriptional regulator [Sutcliffiella]|uniref:GntR family transcriptional regulator n=1 Tax=Sutcliffiella cohnii TaxID=33932 RepID=A0A223KQ57_9BACI|nr:MULTISPECIES: GntR family transcriptional regulator [Sutcliffiella]AST91463.1 GntR family transcriptional regulator [Sutcliffiella cohnii]MED4014974.1 GntR family transcriptional regulator [Sutcliffiella cohnii]WBL17292.1 GntR family transcriptional regulator [Sutcliffiella sp. NC1]